MWLVGVASGCGEQEVGVASGCGCKEVYRIPHTTYPYSSCICSFYSSIPTFCSLKNVFVFLQYRALVVPLIRPCKVTKIYIHTQYMHACKHTCTCTRTHTRTSTHACTCTYTCTCTHTRTHTHVQYLNKQNYVLSKAKKHGFHS